MIAENLFLAGTYKAILRHVADAALVGADLKFNSVVNSISSNVRNNQSKSITVSTNEDQHTFDEVVMTTPLGWLKYNVNAFHPPLPPRLLKSISNLSYGRLEKVYITFSSAFWVDPDQQRA